jgi:hypothetical protein
MRDIFSSLCNAGDIFKMFRPLQGLFVSIDSSTVCKTVSAIVFNNNILQPVGLHDRLYGT